MFPTDDCSMEMLRPAGNLERWSTGRHEQGFLHNIGVSCAYTTRDSRLVASSIYSALAAVIQQHPILSAIPIEEGPESLNFVRLPYVDLGKVVKFVHRDLPYDGVSGDKELDGFLEKQLNIPFGTDSCMLPYWRIFILSSPFIPNDVNITIIYHHGITDGMSGAIFHTCLASALNSGTPCPLRSFRVRSPQVSLLPNLEMIHPMKTCLTRRLLIDHTAVWTGNNIQTPVIGRFRSTAFSSNVTERLRILCRTRQTTITATIQVILAIALFRVIPDDYTTLCGATPVDLRRWLNRPIYDSSIGVYVSSVLEKFHREDLKSFSWSDARAARENISDFLDLRGRYLDCAWLKHLLALNHSMLKLLGKKRDVSFEISNLGDIGAKMIRAESEKATWTTNRMVFSRSATVYGSALGCAIITEADGCLVLGYDWQLGVIKTKLVEEVISIVEQEILKLVQ